MGQAGAVVEVKFQRSKKLVHGGSGQANLSETDKIIKSQNLLCARADYFFKGDQASGYDHNARIVSANLTQ